MNHYGCYRSDYYRMDFSALSEIGRKLVNDAQNGTEMGYC